jgi:hypothetical protein
MAHFAELDENNRVLRVIVVSNADNSNSNGEEDESVGAAFCNRLLGGRWIQTSYNARIRKNYAGIGYTYNNELDAFVPPQPFSAWILNQETVQWEPPVPLPDDGQRYTWDNESVSWKVLDSASTPPAQLPG